MINHQRDFPLEVPLLINEELSAPRSSARPGRAGAAASGAESRARTGRVPGAVIHRTETIKYLIPVVSEPSKDHRW